MEENCGGGHGLRAKERERERGGEYKIAIQWVIGAKKVKVKQSKAVPLHAMEAHGGRGGIAPHSRPRH